MQDPRGFEALYMQDPIGAMGGLLNPDDLIPVRLSDIDNEESKRPGTRNRNRSCTQFQLQEL